MLHSGIVSDYSDLAFPRDALLSWYRKHARALPWREDRDPYRIWVSEVMLQQTRVDTVIPYYERFMEIYPTVQDLASADQDQLLKVWEGLGYYNRALNLQKAAQILSAQFDGVFPEDPDQLTTLPGIGPYTAGAIASIAFDQPAPILDGNLKRLYTRYFGIDSPIQETGTVKELWEVSRALVSSPDPGDFNQALMELGALVCTPQNPDCDRCPISMDCIASLKGLQDQLPVKKPKAAPPHHQVTAAVISKDQQVLIAKRPQEGLLGGLWEFPGGKQEAGESLQEALRREIKEELAGGIEVGDLLGIYQHAYTHYRVTLHAYRCRLVSEKLQLLYHTEIAWTDLESLADYPMGKLDRMISDQLRSEES